MPVEALVATGAQRIYGVARESLNGITDAIRRRAASVAALVRMAATLGLSATRYEVTYTNV